MSSLRIPRAAALTGITTLVMAAAVASFAESYRALVLWALAHGLHGLWAGIFPVQVDSFIAVGELALFVALADQWSTRSRAGAWLVTGLGLAVSVAANVGHVGGHDFASRLTAAVPPLAASAALAVGLGVLKRVVASKAAKTEPDVQPVAIETLTAASRPSLTLAWPRLSSAGGVTVSRAPEGVPAKRAPRRAPAKRASTAKPRASVTPETAFAAELAAGTVPSLRTIKSTLRVGTNRARDVRDHLIAVAAEGAA